MNPVIVPIDTVLSLHAHNFLSGHKLEVRGVVRGYLRDPAAQITGIVVEITSGPHDGNFIHLPPVYYTPETGEEWKA